MMRYLYFLLFLWFVSFSCTENLEDLNENPNQPEAVDAGVLFTSAIRSSMNASVMESFLIGNNAAQLTAKTPASDPGNILDMEAFLQLLVTQLQYQNPLSPMNNEQFIAQTAEFSSLEQMQNLNASIQALIEFQKSSSRMAALDLIGKNVTVQHSTFQLSDGSTVNSGYSLSGDASVTVNIYDAYGNSVRTINMGNKLAGNHNFAWDGLNDEGVQMPDGIYSYKISAIDTDGNVVNASETVSGVVDGLIFEGEQPYISIGGLRVSLGAVTKVSQDTPED